MALAIKNSHYGPKIVKDGLVLALDAGNTKSYPGSGTTWTDRSGQGNTGTLTNGPTYSSVNGGSIVFDGIDDYVNITSNTNVAGITDYSVSIWVYLNSGSSGIDSRFFWRGNYTVLLSKDINNQFFFYIRNSNNFAISIGGVGNSSSILGKWNNLALTNSASTMSAYLNGNLVASTSMVGVFANDSPTLVNLGFYPAAGSPCSCRISNCLEYIRTLTSSEVKQNFNALRGRYGI